MSTQEQSATPTKKSESTPTCSGRVTSELRGNHLNGSKRGNPKRCQGLSPGSQDQNLALTVLCVPHSLDSSSSVSPGQILVLDSPGVCECVSERESVRVRVRVCVCV